MSNSITKILMMGSILLLLAGCSPSTHTSRYNEQGSGRYSSSREKENNETTGEVTPPQTIIEYKDSFLQNYSKMLSDGVNFPSRVKLTIELVKYLNTPYIYGGESETGFDCSGFTQTVYKNALDLNIPRTAELQSYFGTPVERNDLSFGDIILFKINDRRRVDHVGIYLGESLFIHSGASRGVNVASLTTEYFAVTYAGARRVYDFVNENRDPSLY